MEQWALSVLEATDDALTWRAAADWLTRLESQAAYEPLVRMMWSHLTDARSWQLIRGVGAIGGERAIPELQRILTDYKPDAGSEQYIKPYLEAARALVKLGDPTGRMALEDAINSPLWKLRWEVSFYLYWTKMRPLLEHLTTDQDEEIAGRARYWLTEQDRRKQQE